MPFVCLRFSDWPILIHNWVYISHRVLSDPYSDDLLYDLRSVKKRSF